MALTTIYYLITPLRGAVATDFSHVQPKTLLLLSRTDNLKTTALHEGALVQTTPPGTARR